MYVYKHMHTYTSKIHIYKHIHIIPITYMYRSIYSFNYIYTLLYTLTYIESYIHTYKQIVINSLLHVELYISPPEKHPFDR